MNFRVRNVESVKMGPEAGHGGLKQTDGTKTVKWRRPGNKNWNRRKWEQQLGAWEYNQE